MPTKQSTREAPLPVKNAPGGDVLKFSDLVVATSDEVLAEISAIALADFNELIEYRRGACRYCHGLDHKFQYRTAWAEAGARRAFERTADGLVAEFASGGDGYRREREPHPECPECEGLGVEYPVVKDTRNISPRARRLYAGVKLTKEGVEVKTHSKDKALELLMRHYGLLNDKLNAKITGALTVVSGVPEPGAELV